MDDHVRYGLGLDPFRAGESGAVGIWMEGQDAEKRLSAKGRSDLFDMAALIEKVVQGEQDGSDT